MLTPRIPGITPTKTSLVLVSGPVAEPVSLALAKTHLRVDFTDDDVLIAAYITAARELCESYTGRAFSTETWDLFLDDFPRADYPTPRLPPGTYSAGGGFEAARSDITLELPVNRVTAVTYIKYYDSGDVQQTLDPTLYQLDTASLPARVLPKNGQPWPDVSTTLMNTVNVRFTAGEAVPQRFAQAVLLLVGDWYATREADSFAYRGVSIPFAVKSLLDTLKIRGMP